jgi:8-oxo-dGTP pyrophosphatase MutT (NUDIX family)
VSESKPAFKIPQSVLVVIHTPALEVLLIRRADAADYWQSVTGSKDDLQESLCRKLPQREVLEETGIDCRPGTLGRPAARLATGERLRDLPGTGAGVMRPA